jgi:hypothetical protein
MIHVRSAEWQREVHRPQVVAWASSSLYGVHEDRRCIGNLARGMDSDSQSAVPRKMLVFAYWRKPHPEAAIKVWQELFKTIRDDRDAAFSAVPPVWFVEAF